MSETTNEYNPNIDIVVMIGNSDDKLTQVQWSEFGDYVFETVENYAASLEVHGTWWSDGGSPYQNAAICATIPGALFRELSEELRRVAGVFKQESIAVLAGTTEFLAAT